MSLDGKQPQPVKAPSTAKVSKWSDEERKELVSLKRDKIFGMVMQDEALLKPLLEDIIKRPIKKILRVETQKSVEVAVDGRPTAIIADVIAELNDTEINIEVQNREKGWDSKRARVYSSMLDIRYYSNSGEGKYDIGDSYVVLLANYTDRNTDSPIQHFQMQAQDGALLGDGRHIIYVYCTRWDWMCAGPLQDVSSRISGESTDSEYGSEVDDALDRLRCNGKVVEDMYLSEIERKELLHEGREEGRKEGRDKGYQEFYRALLEDGVDPQVLARTARRYGLR